jgi:hypothetical protein
MTKTKAKGLKAKGLKAKGLKAKGLKAKGLKAKGFCRIVAFGSESTIQSPSGCQSCLVLAGDWSTRRDSGHRGGIPISAAPLDEDRSKTSRS